MIKRIEEQGGIEPKAMDPISEIILKAGSEIIISGIKIGIKKRCLVDSNPGVTLDSCNAIGRNKIFLQIPTGRLKPRGYKSLNINTYKFLGLNANV